MSKMARFLSGAFFAVILFCSSALPAQAAGLASAQIHAVASVFQAFSAGVSSIVSDIKTAFNKRSTPTNIPVSKNSTKSTVNIPVSKNVPASNNTPKPVYSAPSSNPTWGEVTFGDLHLNYGAFDPIAPTKVEVPGSGTIVNGYSEPGTSYLTCSAGYYYPAELRGGNLGELCFPILPDPIILSDATWVNYPLKTPPSTWKNVGFDDSSWEYSAGEGPFGNNPWPSVAGFPYKTAAQWIWYYGSNNSTAQGNMTAYFRKTFTPTVSSAILTIVADDLFTAYLNGVQIVAGGTGMTAHPIKISLNPNETNVLAVKVTNTGGPGGLIVDLR
jgi:hypothetical protein